MKRFLVSLFIVVSSFSIYDTNDPKKVILAIEYDNGWIDKIIVDREKLKDHNSIWKVVEKIINERNNE